MLRWLQRLWASPEEKPADFWDWFLPRAPALRDHVQGAMAADPPDLTTVQDVLTVLTAHIQPFMPDIELFLGADPDGVKLDFVGRSREAERAVRALLAASPAVDGWVFGSEAVEPRGVMVSDDDGNRARFSDDELTFAIVATPGFTRLCYASEQEFDPRSNPHLYLAAAEQITVRLLGVLPKEVDQAVLVPRSLLPDMPTRPLTELPAAWEAFLMANFRVVPSGG